MANCRNDTPIFVVGDYRGLEVDHAFVKGEWQAKITQTSAVIVDPNGKQWAVGVVRQYTNQLWLVTADGTRKGIFGIQETPEVSVLTWALGNIGGDAPTSFDNGLTSGVTFVFAKCLHAERCKWQLFQTRAQLLAQQQAKAIPAKWSAIQDPCSQFPDCSSCIKAPQWCGWCSVPILYNETVVGKNCAGLNTTVTPRINCTGTFSTQDCSHATTSSTGSTSTGQTTGGPPSDKKYYCDPSINNGTCVESTNGTLPKDVCSAQCTVTPIVPPVLQNKYYRGLEINMGYVKGEWRAHFTAKDVTVVAPDGTVIQGTVTTTANYLTIHMAGGDIQTVWQTQVGPAVDNLAWAWGAKGGKAPTFDSGMNTPGQTEYWFVSCHDGANAQTCDFSK